MWQDIRGLDADSLDGQESEAIAKLQTSSYSPEATLFTSYEEAFLKLSARTDEIVIKHILREVNGELKPYIAK